VDIERYKQLLGKREAEWADVGRVSETGTGTCKNAT
jgi:hypothetical protein